MDCERRRLGLWRGGGEPGCSEGQAAVVVVGKEQTVECGEAGPSCFCFLCVFGEDDNQIWKVHWVKGRDVTYVMQSQHYCACLLALCSHGEQGLSPKTVPRKIKDKNKQQKRRLRG